MGVRSVWKVLARRKTTLRGEDGTLCRQNRTLTIVDITCLGLAVSLGVGVYVALPNVAREQAGPAVILSFLIAAVASCLSGLCYAEVATRFPEGGSAYVYAYATGGEFIAYLVGWAMVLDYGIAACLSVKAISRHSAAMLNSAFFQTNDSSILSYYYHNHSSSPASHHFRIFHHHHHHTASPSSSSSLLWTISSSSSSSSLSPLAFASQLSSFPGVPGLESCPDIVAAVVPVVVCLISIFGRQKCFIVLVNTTTVINAFVVFALILTGFFKMEISNWTAGAGFFPYGIVGVFNGAAVCTFCFIGYDLIAQASGDAEHRHRVIPTAVSLVFLISLMACFCSSVAVTLLVPHDLLVEPAPLLKASIIRDLPGLAWILTIGSLCGLLAATLAAIDGMARLISSLSLDGLLMSPTKNRSVSVIVSTLLVSAASIVVRPEIFLNILGMGTLLSLITASAVILSLRYGVAEKLPLEMTSLSRESSCINGSACFSDYGSCPNGNALRSNWSVEFVNQSAFVTCLKSPPTAKSANKTALLVVAMVALMFVMALLTIHVPEIIHSDNGVSRWYLEGLATLVFVAVLCLMTLVVRQPRHLPDSTSRSAVPCVPFLPLCAIWMDVHLCVCLPYTAWLAFLAWQLFGTGIYLSYGVWHSHRRRKRDNRNGSDDQDSKGVTDSDDVAPLTEYMGPNSDTPADTPTQPSKRKSCKNTETKIDFDSLPYTSI